ncbi:MAG: energy-coupling factor ABC transporter ATP-binding protein [Oscillospiraceae bacterium]|jgi:energy-coupling factor transport system ATP-binding protein|nr:energy-coupling factor ABC transporter ATP-binding protein [Oscillospiraceae bacterium]
MTEMVRLSNVSYSIESHVLINGVSLRVDKGEFVALAGENGAGKSTLLKLIMGLIKPSDGDILIEGTSTRRQKVSTLARSVGYLFQNPDRQLFGATIRQELTFGLDFLGVSKDDGERRVNETLELLNLNPDRAPTSLSRGERQRVALASLFVRRPTLLLLDEPTTGLDYRECSQMMNQVAALNRESGVTVLMITHDMEVALDFSERMMVLSEGKLIADGATRSVMRDETSLRRASLVPAQMVALAQRLGLAPGEADDAESLADWIADNARGGADDARHS